ncbi:hypothetical protein C8R46DRAFT_1271410, partial [Mycena filopes]
MAQFVSPVVSVLISIWLETLLYGINIPIFAFSLYMTFNKPSVSYVVPILSTALFICATGHIGVNLCRLIQGYIQPPTKGVMAAFLVNLTVKSNVAKQILLAMVNLFSDTLLTWRVYMVWGKRWTIGILPAVLTVASEESLVEPGQSVFLKQISQWGTAQFASSLAMNLTATILIASRIWYVTRILREVSPERMGPYWRIITIVVESASSAAVAQIIQLAMYEAKFPGVYFISDSVVQVVTMASLTIVILVGAGGQYKNGLGTSYNITELRFNVGHSDTTAGVQVGPHSRDLDVLVDSDSSSADVHRVVT